MSDAPLDFYCGFHLHQPVGNFGEVFESHIRDVYRPLLAHLAARPRWPVIVHVSGPLFEWCERHDHSLIDDLARLAADGRTEFLLAGFYEPVLASLGRDDRLQQVAWMREYLEQRFGARDTGAWITERVWEPDLTRELADAGVTYALVDDRHFLVSGHTRATMGQCFRTEHDGRHLDLLPIDERLRYLIPFQPVPNIVEHFRREHAAGARLAVFADDGEKFGGWPHTREWVYGSGWMNAFLDGMLRLEDEGLLRLVRGPQVLSESPRGGLAYLATASYHEMEEWSLPLELGVRHLTLVAALGEARMAGPDNAFVRGAHWKHFLVKYPEANRAHKHMSLLSALCHERGNPVGPRRAIGRAQCNDSLWHGVFGGLYLPWLREAMWANLAEAEHGLRVGETLAVQMRDVDGDGMDEVLVHGAHVSVTLSPQRGGAVEVYLLLDARENAADALTRRVEAYHHAAVAAGTAQLQQGAAAQVDHSVGARGGANERADGVENGEAGGVHTTEVGSAAATSDAVSAPSIHDIEQQNTLLALPPADLDVRSLLQVRVVDGALTEAEWRDASYEPIASFTRSRMHVVGAPVVSVPASGTACRIDMAGVNEATGYTVALTVHENGALTFAVDWHATEVAQMTAWSAMVAFEASLYARTGVTVTCDVAAARWDAPIESIAKSERGLERTVQGRAVLFLVPIAAGAATVTFTPPAR